MIQECDYAEATVTVGSPMGLHGRPAAQIVKIATGFKAELTLEKTGDDNASADCRSVLSLLVLAAGKGTQLILKGEGEDAGDAVRTIADFFAGNFNE